MKISACILLLFLHCISFAQSGDMRVYTVAGGPLSAPLGDGGPATAAQLANTEGIWMDDNCNLYISDMYPNQRIRKVNTVTGIISTIAGNGTKGFAGDGGPATNAQINTPYGLFADPQGNVFFADNVNGRIRKVDAVTGIITTFAGGGATLNDGGPATNANIGLPRNVYGDKKGNFYIASDARIRKIDKSGIITTIAGTGVSGLSGDGGPATAAQLIAGVDGMIMNSAGDLFIADRGNARIRKITATTGIITTVAGSTDGFSGDGGPATAAQMSGPISIFLDNKENLIIGDNQNDVIRKVDANTHIITTIAGMQMHGSSAEGIPATAASLHPEFIYIDLSGNIYYSTFDVKIRKITNYIPGLHVAGSNCGSIVDVSNVTSDKTDIRIYPNPANDELHINNLHYKTNYTLLNTIGQSIQQGLLKAGDNNIFIESISNGVYLLQLTDIAGTRTLTKVIKQ